MENIRTISSLCAIPIDCNCLIYGVNNLRKISCIFVYLENVERPACVLQNDTAACLTEANTMSRADIYEIQTQTKTFKTSNESETTSKMREEGKSVRWKEQNTNQITVAVNKNTNTYGTQIIVNEASFRITLASSSCQVKSSWRRRCLSTTWKTIRLFWCVVSIQRARAHFLPRVSWTWRSQKASAVMMEVEWGKRRGTGDNREIFTTQEIWIDMK